MRRRKLDLAANAPWLFADWMIPTTETFQEEAFSQCLGVLEIPAQSVLSYKLKEEMTQISCAWRILGTALRT